MLAEACSHEVVRENPVCMMFSQCHSRSVFPTYVPVGQQWQELFYQERCKTPGDCSAVHKDHTYSMCFSPSQCSGAKTENRKLIKKIIAKTFFFFETGLKVGGGGLKV